MTTFRDRKQARTRTLLIEAAVDLFEERGFDAVTVGQIAERAWVSERTFFRYFGSKEDVLWPESGDQLDAFAGAIVARPAAERPLVAVRRAMLELAPTMASGAGFPVRRASIVAATPTLLARDLAEHAGWERAVRDAVASRTGARRDDVAPAMVAVAAGGVLRVAFARWVAGGADGDLRELIDSAFDSLEHEVCG